jgi:hypothetical protein
MHNKPKTYEDVEWCGHCEKDTKQTIHDSGHERDSSNDWRICHECLWHYSGWSGEWSPPCDTDENEGEMTLPQKEEVVVLKKLPRPLGDFIFLQKDIPSVQGANGAYYHYNDVCTLLKRAINQNMDEYKY